MNVIKRIDEFNQQKRRQHRIIDTDYGEVMLIQVDDYCEAYIGDNYDDYIGDVDCKVSDSETYIKKKISELFSEQ